MAPKTNQNRRGMEIRNKISSLVWSEYFWLITFTEIFNNFYVIFFHRYGPCDYVYSGLELKKNLNWAPELLDLLHRLIGMTRSDFNSCFANLYRHGKFCIIILTDNVQFFFCVFFNFTEIFSHRT